MLSFFSRDVLDEIWDLIESVSEGFPTHFFLKKTIKQKMRMVQRFKYHKLKGVVNPGFVKSPSQTKSSVLIVFTEKTGSIFHSKIGSVFVYNIFQNLTPCYLTTSLDIVKNKFVMILADL